MTAIFLKIIPWVVAGLSLASIAFIVFKKIPVLLKLPAAPPEGQEQVFGLRAVLVKIGTRLRGLRYSSYQPALVSWLEKVLRRLRLLVLKIDSVFVSWIGQSREKSQIWTVRSRAWMEQHRLKKIQKLQVLEKLDQAEILETIQKAKEDVRKEEIKNGKIEPEEAGSIMTQKIQTTTEAFVRDKEKKFIDEIARDPRNVEAYKQLGFLYCEQGNKDDAKNCFRQVLKLNPDDFEVISKIREMAE